MARYFFELSEGDRIIPDDLGSVCKDDQTAMTYAWTTLTACVGDPTQILPWQRAEISVRREDERYIGRVAVTIEVETDSPVTAAALSGVAERQGQSPEG